MIVTPAGMNVYPEDLEKAVRSQLGVRDCVVIGIERDGNAEPCAVLLLENPPHANQPAIIENANHALAEYQKIRHWFPWPDPDFPRTPTLKPLLPRIRELVNAKLDTAVTSQDGNSSLATLIAQITGRPVTADSRSATLDADLHMTSLDRVELMSALESRYQTDLSDVRFGEVSTVGQLEKLLAESSAPRVEHPYPRWPQNWLTTAVRLGVYYLLGVARHLHSCRTANPRQRKSPRAARSRPAGRKPCHLSGHRLGPSGFARASAQSAGYRDARRTPR